MILLDVPQGALRSEALEELGERVGDALDLAVAAGAPLALIDKLATASGLLNALREVPRHVLMPHATSRAKAALSAWESWRGRSARASS
jgi:hypothetical protein